MINRFHFIALFLMLFVCLNVSAQRTPSNIVSPEFHKDGTISFRIKAPEAKK